MIVSRRNCFCWFHPNFVVVIVFRRNSYCWFHPCNCGCISRYEVHRCWRNLTERDLTRALPDIPDLMVRGESREFLIRFQISWRERISPSRSLSRSLSLSLSFVLFCAFALSFCVCGFLSFSLFLEQVPNRLRGFGLWRNQCVTSYFWPLFPPLPLLLLYRHFLKNCLLSFYGLLTKNNRAFRKYYYYSLYQYMLSILRRS